MAILILIVLAALGVIYFLAQSGKQSKSAPRSAPVDHVRPAPRQTVNAGPGDAERARTLLNRFKDSQTPRGGDAAARSAVLAIARAGSSWDSPIHAPTDRDFMIKLTDNIATKGDAGMDEPWNWLAGVAESAVKSHDMDLLASVVSFTTNWLGYLTPNIGPADEQDMRLLKGVPHEARVKIFTLALHELPQADLNRIVIDTPIGSDRPMTIFHVVVGTAMEVCKAPKDYSDSLASVAHGLVNQ